MWTQEKWLMLLSGGGGRRRGKGSRVERWFCDLVDLGICFFLEREVVCFFGWNAEIPSQRCDVTERYNKHKRSHTHTHRFTTRWPKQCEGLLEDEIINSTNCGVSHTNTRAAHEHMVDFLSEICVSGVCVRPPLPASSMDGVHLSLCLRECVCVCVCVWVSECNPFSICP